MKQDNGVILVCYGVLWFNVRVNLQGSWKACMEDTPVFRGCVRTCDDSLWFNGAMRLD